MAISVVRLGAPRVRGEGTRLGTVRRPPRGVKKTHFAKHDWYDVWVPDVAPSAQLVSWATTSPWTDERWKRFAREYRREMREPHAARLIGMLAVMSHDSNFSIGCYCEDATRCHRVLLAELLEDAGAEMTRS